MNWLIKLIFVAVSEVMLGVVQFLAPAINNIFDFMYQVNLKFNLNNLSNYTVGIGLSLVSLFAVKQSIDVYMLHTEGDPDADPLELITRVCVTVAVIVCGQPIVTYLIKTSGILCNEVLSKVAYQSRTIAEILTDSFMKLLSMSTILAAIQAGFAAVIVVSLIIFMLMASKRGAELIWFQIILPFFALDLLNANKERWNSFKNDLIVCIYGYVLQVVCFNIFMMLLSNAMTVDGVSENPLYVIAPIGWLMVILSTPKWLQKHMYTSGVGSALGRGASMGTYLVPNLLLRK